MQQAFVCPRCGGQNPGGQQFCVACGTRLFGQQQQVQRPQQQFSCPGCGQAVPHGLRFCGNCGIQINSPTQQTVQHIPVYPQQPPVVSQQAYVPERKLLFIPSASTHEFGIRQFYNLVITDRRVIAGRTGVGVYKYSAISKALQDKTKYADLEPEQILQADERNFALRFNNLKTLELKGGVLGGQAYMVIHDRSGDSKKIFFDKKYYADVLNAFRQFAGFVLK